MPHSRPPAQRDPWADAHPHARYEEAPRTSPAPLAVTQHSYSLNGPAQRSFMAPVPAPAPHWRQETATC